MAKSSNTINMSDNNETPIEIKKARITLQTEIVFTLKTIITVIISIGSLLWGYHEFVLDKQLIGFDEDLERVEEKLDKVYDHMIGIGSSNKETKPAIEPIESDETEGRL
jgi:hypothetical protein